MRKLFSVAIITLLSVNAWAQQVDLRKKITVTGSAEAEVTPDIIYLGISLKEYLKDNNSKRKIEITTLENQLYTAIVKAGIAKENLSINNLYAYSYATEKKKNPDFLASKQYRLKLTDLNKFNEIIEAIDAKGIAFTNIESYDYSKIESLKKELKIKAILAAKNKASYLVEALGDKLGNIIDVQEIGDNNYPQPMYSANVMMDMKSVGNEAAAPAELDFKKIKFNFVIQTVFEIK
ncbi:MAG: DUF541 domain-containing protein [Sphingobacteriales bacterium]|nr:MAG: DUF541 domain-containing protein [Sphingobacteriales bacterium]TAF81143.1 MAG: DUF541 domain-containing protein [Sphingobacteriales bacterium]